jgi:hypothetical protein
VERLVIESVQALVLLVAALLAAAVWRKVGTGVDTAFWLLASVGSAVLALDERLEIHGRLGETLYSRGVREPGPINHLDDILLMVIAAAGVALVVPFLRELRRDAAMFRVFAAGALLLVFAVGWDAFASTKGSASWWFEESVELCGGLCVAGAFALRAGHVYGYRRPAEAGWLARSSAHADS